MLIAAAALAGCAPVETRGEELDYDTTKKMIVDILKSDDGRKAIEDLMKEDGLREKLIMDQAVVKDTVENTLVSEKGTEFWKKSFEDPKFAESYAKSLQKEHEKLLKGLMADPAYRAMMVEIMKEPDLEKELVDTLKGNEYRKHIEKVITETLENPIYQAKLQDMIIKASEEIGKKQEEKQSEGENEGNEE